MKPSNLVRMTFYTTDVQGFMAAADKLSKIWGDAGAMPVTTLVEWSRNQSMNDSVASSNVLSEAGAVVRVVGEAMAGRSNG